MTSVYGMCECGGGPWEMETASVTKAYACDKCGMLYRWDVESCGMIPVTNVTLSRKELKFLRQFVVSEVIEAHKHRGNQAMISFVEGLCTVLFAGLMKTDNELPKEWLL